MRCLAVALLCLAPAAAPVAARRRASWNASTLASALGTLSKAELVDRLVQLASGAAAGGGAVGAASISRRLARGLVNATAGGRRARKLIGRPGAAKGKARRAAAPLNASLLESAGPPPPPCGPAAPSVAGRGARTPPPAAARAKAAARQRTCHQLTAYQSTRAGRMPLVWSRQLAASRRAFRNENPFETGKFGAFLPQLPATSDLAGLWRGGCDECASCAVVGASGSLLNHKHGALIDSHQVVLRPNWLRTKGYEALVGRRTHLNLFFGVEGMIFQFDASQRKLPPAERAIGLVTPASDRSVASFFRHMARVRRGENRTRAGRQGVFLLSDDVYHRALGHLCRHTDGGCGWAKHTSRMRPSTGFFSVVIAMQLCRNVSLFGLSTDPCKPFHYYGDPAENAACKAAIPKQNDESVHWFGKEHEIYRAWEREGRLRQYS